MAKIRNEYIRTSKKGFSVTIVYLARKKHFTIKPISEWENFSKLIKIPIPVASTEDELISKLKEFAQRYVDSNTKTRKVIAYSVDWQSKNIDSHYCDRSWGDGWDKAVIEFDYMILKEERVEDNILFYKNNIPCHHVKTGEWKIIEWTKEREEFMKNFYKAMELLMGRMKEFMGDPERLVTAIENKVRMLPNK